MQRIIYYVAVSLDGYIAGPEEDISMFMQSGPGVDHYLNELQSFKTVIMGRKTYEFGYKFGLEPGQPAYPGMEHFVFSNSLTFNKGNGQVNVCQPKIEAINQIKDQSVSDIYLCGGGKFAGWLLQNNLIDELKLKLNPIVLGSGTPLFKGVESGHFFKLKERLAFEDGIQILTYNLN